MIERWGEWEKEKYRKTKGLRSGDCFSKIKALKENSSLNKFCCKI